MKRPERVVTVRGYRAVLTSPFDHLEGHHLHRTRFELIAERKVRRRKLTDDGNVEIIGRDLREQEAAPTANRIGFSSAIKAAQQAARDAERRFPVRVRIAVQ